MKILLVLAAVLVAVSGHARLWNPVNRNSAWRKGFPGPVDYDDISDMCGRARYDSDQIPASCQPCGVPNFPKDGVIVKTYKSGQKLDIQIGMTADHIGYFTFRICPNPGDATEDCFRQHRLPVFNSPNPTKPDRYDWSQFKGNRIMDIKSQLPAGLRCEHCVFQWTWQTNNQAGNPSEVWRQCADIKIE